jgi:heme/copper-type cytochrome/quinol oxidase subunit 2
MEVVNTTSTTDPVNMYNNLNSFIMNPIVFVIIILIVVAYYVFTSLGKNNSFSTSDSSSGSKSNIIIIIIVVILVILIFIQAFQYFFSINLTAYVQGLFTPNTQVNVVVDHNTTPMPVPAAQPNTIQTNKQVFNIPGNYYNYENAKALCQAYGADLATYDQIERAYNNGAEWCNYGWSANQLALFPTQKKTYDNLQKIQGHENDCGRPGVNGGYMANPRIRFGVNCYGNKPKINNEEEELMKTYTPYPETMKEKVFQKRVDFWKNRINEILVSPFNYNVWAGSS